MRIKNTKLTDGLRLWLAHASDVVMLAVRQDGRDIIVERPTTDRDAAVLTPAEETEVRALLAAHAAQPLQPPTRKRTPAEWRAMGEKERRGHEFGGCALDGGVEDVRDALFASFAAGKR